MRTALAVLEAPGASTARSESDFGRSTRPGGWLGEQARRSARLAKKPCHPELDAQMSLRWGVMQLTSCKQMRLREGGGLWSGRDETIRVGSVAGRLRDGRR